MSAPSTPDLAAEDLAETCRRRANGLTVPSLLHRNASEFPDLPALTAVGVDGPTLTWADVRARVAELARGFAEAGVRPGDLVLIMMSSRPEHWLVDLAVGHLGGIPSTVYATLSPDQLRYLAEHSRAKLIVLEGEPQLARWRPILDSLTFLRTVVVLDEAALPAAQVGGPRFVPLSRVASSGAMLHASDPEVFERGWRMVDASQPVTVLYTSGTTGEPKAVALSHHNVIYQAVVLEAVSPTPPHSASVAYLPLAHIAERMLGIYIPLYRAGHVHICADPTQVLGALQQVRPAGFFGVPRIWEKVAAGLQARLGAAPEEQRAAMSGAMELARTVYRLRMDGAEVPADLAARLAAVDQAALRPLRTMLGMDNAVSLASGAAPIPVDVLMFLAGLGIDVYEVWGMTETTGTATLNTPTAFRVGTVGRVNIGMQLRLAADGEIEVRGPLVCLGYLQGDGTIQPATDADGWLATGDVGTIDEDGYLTITDRKKELIITSGGKNIAPAQIENLLRINPIVGYAVAIGDRRPYVTALIVLDEEMAPLWAGSQGLPSTAVADLATHPAVSAHVQATVDAANAKLSQPEAVKRFAILPAGWTAESGELTPKLSLRRRVIVERYADVIDALYAEGD
jgi:long-chain acyl-CoA synthetase